MPKPAFSIRGLLGVTTFVALSCVVLMKPSVYWVYPIPFVLCVLAVGAVERVWRSYWLSVVAGVAVCILMTAAISALYGETSAEFRLGWAFDLYKLIHDDSSNETITAFMASVHFISALAVAAITAYLAQLIWPPKRD
jgi:hypothetical protein